MDADTLRPGDRLGPYLIDALIGRGGMGVVYRARDTRLERLVAIKVLAPEVQQDPVRRRRLEREARATAALTDPHICVLFDIGREGALDYLVMEHLAGETLDARRRRAPIGVEEAVAWSREIAGALASAHAAGVVHRDLKPQNVMLTASGVKVLDFGVAWQSRPGSGTVTTTAATIVGTPRYMSPEQALGREPDPRSDLFSLGVVLYEMLAGRPPFEGTTAGDVLHAVVTAAPTPVAVMNGRVSPALAAIVARLLEKDPAARFQSARDVLDAFDRITASPQRAEAAPARRVRRQIAAAVAVVAIAVAAAVVATRWRSAVATPPVVIVLPTSVSAPPQFAALADTVPRDLTSGLRRAAGLALADPPTPSQTDLVKGDRTRIAAAYGATLLVASQLSIVDRSLRFEVRTYDAADRPRWSAQYVGDRSEYDGLINAAVADLARLVKPDQPAQTAAAPASEAEFEYLEARHAARDPSAFADAVKHYERAFALESTKARAPVGLAQLYLRRAREMHAEADVETARQWARRAIAVDAGAAEGWEVLATAEESTGHADAGRMFDYALSAVKAAPGRAQSIAVLYESLGASMVLALASATETRRLAPLSDAAYLGEALMFSYLGRTGEALLTIGRGRDLFPRANFIELTRAFVLSEAGSPSDAQRALDGVPERSRNARAFAPMVLATRYNLARGSEQERLLSTIRAEAASPAAIAHDLNWYVLLIAPRLIERNRIDAALELVERARRAGEPPAYDWLLLNPRLRAVADDPRFQPARADSRTQFGSLVARIDAARKRGDWPVFLERPYRDLLDALSRPGR